MNSHTTPTTTAKNGTAAASAAAFKKMMASRAAAHHHNVMAAKYFAAAMTGFILLFSIVFWIRFLYARYASKSIRESSIMKAQVAFARLVRQVLNHPAYGFKSVGHLVVVLLYLGINIALIVTYVDYRTLIGPAKRCGWIAFCNIAFLVFLALKNTPLAFLTAHSYETLNPLHQVAGYTTMVTALVHFTVECLHMERTHKAYELVEHEQIFGMIAACSMFVIFLTTLGMKKLRYELFYIVHVTMFMLILITLGLHRPDLADKEVIVILIAASMWGSDRIIRGFRILYYSRANEATIHPLPHGGTRIVLCRSPSRAIPGTHCFLWLPTIRKFETHPFTIVRTSPNLELVINAYDGFTSDLHNYAVKYPGKSLRASVDGPYGAIPDFASTADKVILIAGGSGASFTFGVALDAIKRLPASSNTTIDFVWTVREEEAVTWFAKELAELQHSPRVSLFLYTTRPSPANTGSSTPTSPMPAAGLDEEKSIGFDVHAQATPTSPSISSIEKKDTETPLKSKYPHPWDSRLLDVAPGRPNVPAIINDVVRRSGRHERILIGACGPDSLMWDVRRAATNAISVSGPSVELHGEQFGW